jgi:hypothetical protein
VTAEGVLYGPFPEPPAEAVAPPADAPIAWSEIVEVDGPGAVTTSGAFTPTEPGHYSWVWTIDAGNQPADSLLPTDYAWSDRFGLATESFEVIEPLPATGAEDDPRWWLGALGAVLLGVGLAGLAAILRYWSRSPQAWP